LDRRRRGALVLVGAAAARRLAPVASAAPPAPEVSVLTVVPETVTARFEYVGQAAASRSVEVRSQVTGVIVARPYAEGTDVAKGTLLFRIDPTTYEAAYRSAQARLANADRTLARLKPLLAERAVAQKDVDDAQQAYDQAQAAVDQTRKDYEDTFVRAEITGRAGRAALELGARCDRFERPAHDGRAGGPHLRELQPVRRGLAAPAARHRGRPAAHAARAPRPRRAGDAGGRQSLSGHGRAELRRSGAAARDRDAAAAGAAQKPATRAAPRAVRAVRLLGLKRPSAILVPQRAVQQGLNGAFVYVVGDSNKVAARNVVATSWDGGSWRIEQGLEAGDRVIVEGVQKVAPGQPARLVAYRPALDSAGPAAQDSTLIAPPAVPLRIRSRP